MDDDDLPSNARWMDDTLSQQHALDGRSYLGMRAGLTMYLPSSGWTDDVYAYAQQCALFSAMRAEWMTFCPAAAGWTTLRPAIRDGWTLVPTSAFEFTMYLPLDGRRLCPAMNVKWSTLFSSSSP